MTVHNLADRSSFTSSVISDSYNNLIVLDCFATWCGPCKVIAPKLVQMSEEFPNVKFYKIDVDEASDVAQELGIRAMPTFIFFKNGEKVAEVVGANEKLIRTTIQQNL